MRLRNLRLFQVSLHHRGLEERDLNFLAKVTLNVALNVFWAFTDPSQRNLCSKYTFIIASLGLLCSSGNDCEAMRMMEFVPS